MLIVDVEQGSEAWFAARLGKVTASRLADVMAGGKGTTRGNYLAQLICERATGKVGTFFENAATRWGVGQEAAARKQYAFMTNNDVRTVGLVLHPTISNSAASPDGLVGDFGQVQFKCPHETAVHLATMRGKPLSGTYTKQIQWELACTGRNWCDFVSYDPRLPPEWQLVIRRVNRDPVAIVEMEREVRAFLAEVDQQLAELNELFPLNLEAAE